MAAATALLAFGAAGAITSSVGAYYGAIAQRYQLKSQAQDLDFQATMAGINARAAEMDASVALEAGRSEKGRRTLQYGQVKAGARTGQAAAGVQAGVGSAGEVLASIEAAKEIDSLTIDRNALRAARGFKSQAVDLRNRSSLARMSAGNARQFAGSISPGLSALTSLLGGAGRVAQSHIYHQALQTR